MSHAGAPSDDAASQNAAQENSSGGKEEVLLRLERDDPTLTSLRVMKHHGKAKDGPYFRPRTEEDWTRLGDAIATNTSLQRLDIIDLRAGNLDMLNTICVRLYSKLNDENRTIRRLVLQNSHSRIVSNHLTRFLEENSCLSSLTITKCNLYDESQHVWTVLSNLGGSLKYLDLSYTSIDGYGMEGLAPHIPTLRSLELNGNSIACEVCARIADIILINPQSALVRLYLDDNRIRDAGAAALAEGLAHMAHSGRLKTLSMEDNRNITSRGYEAFLRTVCNSPGIDDIMRSNHTLERLSVLIEEQLHEGELTHYLHLNRTRNKSHVAGQKVVLHHFAYNCNIELFEGIPGCLVPNILAMMGEHETSPSDKNERTDADAARHNEFVRYDYQMRFRGLHRIVRRCPWICGRTVDTAKTSGGSAAAESAAKKARLS